MIAWRNPAAFLGLLALAAPILIHLLRRQRARRVPFPALRFVRPVSSAAVRVRRISDAVLLAVRLGILALAVCALAQPVLLTGSRVAAWNARTVRAIVVDVSDSMRPFAAERGERVAAEPRGAAGVLRVETRELRDGISEAAALLEAAMPARREIVVVSDLQAGSLDAESLAAVPSFVGVRFAPVGTTPRERRFTGLDTLSGWRQEVALSGAATGVRIVRTSPPREGLRILTADGGGDAERRLLRAVADAGTPAPSGSEPIIVSFRGATLPPAIARLGADWMRRTVVRLQRNEEAARAARDEGARAGPASDGAPWIAVFRNDGGTPVVRAAAAGSALLIEVAALPESFLAAAVVRAALVARDGRVARMEEEVLRISAEDLARWSRPPGTVGPEIARGADVSDARWAWLAALALLGIEGYVRRARRPASLAAQVRVNAA